MSHPLIAMSQARYLAGAREVNDRAMASINRYALTALKAEDIHVRGMYLCNSARDFYYSRFSKDALEEIAELIPGQPVMTSHDTRTLPVGTFFDARVVRIEKPGVPKRDQLWVQADFFAPKDAEGDAMVRRIDMGVYRQNSVSWRCVGADCSICGKDIRVCEHLPGDIYDRGGICEYGFGGVTAVLEGSLVYQGGQKGTSLYNPSGESTVGDAPAAKKRLGDGTRLSDLFAQPGGALHEYRLRQRDRLIGFEPISVQELLDVKRGLARAMMFGTPGVRGAITKIACARSRFEEPADAKRWVREHDFRADKSEDSDTEFNYVQSTPAAEAKIGNVRLDEGVVAHYVKQSSDARSADDTPLERLVGSHQ